MSKSVQELLKEINILHAKYKVTVEGRKEIINEIRQKIKEIRKITNICNSELNELEMYYSYRDYYINDYKYVMSLLYRLANIDEDQYAIGEVTTTDYFKYFDEVNQLYSKILFITEKSIVDNFNNQVFYFDEFSKKASEYINRGYSMIMITSNLFESRVKPRKDIVKCDSVFDIRNGGLNGNISCYINNPFLKEKIDHFVNYVNINGPDFENIDEDTAFELMSKSSLYQKKNVK